MNLASTKRQWPIGRGFERFYGFLGAETNQWYPDLVYDNHPVDWELFDTENDPSECHDLAEQHPAKLRELVGLWWAEAGKYQAFPLESRDAVEILGTETPQLSRPRDRYVYYPGGAEIPESVAPNIRNRSYAIAAEVTIETPEAGGVLLAQGACFGGHALYVKDGKLKYVYNFVGDREQIVESTKEIPTGHVILAAAFEKHGHGMPTQGTLSLYFDDEKVGEGEIMTQPGRFSLAGEGLNVGRDGGEPVTDDYPGQAPWAFVGGTIQRVAVDVSGEEYVDLEREAVAMMSRE